MDTEYGCLGGVTSTVRRRMVWKKFVLLSVTDETRSDDPHPLEFLDETYPTKTRVMGLPYGKNFIILTSTVFV